MMEYFNKIRIRLFPGSSLKEIVANEVKDFFVTGLYRVEFMVMAIYSVVLLVVTILAEEHSYFSASNLQINIAFASLGIYFVVSDFFKRKKIFSINGQFIFDSFFYIFFMWLIILFTGGHKSLIAYPLLFLTTISTPLYSSMLGSVVFVSIISFLYFLMGFVGGVSGDDLNFLFVKALALVAATVIIKNSLSKFEKKVIEYRELSVKNDGLLAELGEFNEKLIFSVEEKTKELSENLLNTTKAKDGLEKQKVATLNILEDMAEERNKTLMEKEKISRIIQSIGDGVFVVDRHKKIIMFNNVAEKISGFLSGEVMNKPYDTCLKFIREKDHIKNDIIERVFDTGNVQELGDHTVLLNKNGKEIPVEDSAAPLIDRDGKVHGCVMIFRDVTKEREIDRQKSEFVSVASHQLRTPLTSIKWFLEMMLDGDSGEISAEQKELLEQVSQSTERMIDLVNKLLNVSRIESGRVKVDPKPADLNELVNSVVMEMTPLVTKKDIIFKLVISKLPTINIDAKLVREAFINLLSNAVKYTPNKGNVTLTIKKRKEDVLFAIKDSGIGIPAKQHSKIFQKFFRAENAVTQETEGTGMGLYVCKSIIELSGGNVWFESKENKGTTFYFTLPLKGSIMREGDKSLV